MSQKLENKTTSELMVIIYIVNCIVMESSEITIKVANTLATFWSMKKKHKSKRTLSCWFREGIWYDWHCFSAFWLRSKCSICSYQLNIWYGSHVLSSILIWFLTGDGVLGLALALSQVSLVLQYHQDRPLPHSTPGSQAICIAIVKRFSWYPFRQRWVLGLAGRDSRRAAGSAYLPGTEVNHDQVGGSSRLSPATLHSVADGIYNYLKRR